MPLGQLFSQRVGYAVHALCYMARVTPQQNLVTIPELSSWMRQVWPGTSETYLANVTRRLVRGEILVSQRGISGGYGFARKPDKITLGDVVAVLEGFSYSRCALTPSGKCPVQYRCKNYHKLCQLQQQYTDLLGEVTIADLAVDMAAPLPNENIEVNESIPA